MFETRFSVEWAEKRCRLEYRIHMGGCSVAEGHEVRAWIGQDQDGNLEGLSIPDCFPERMA